MDAEESGGLSPDDLSISREEQEGEDDRGTMPLERLAVGTPIFIFHYWKQHIALTHSSARSVIDADTAR